MKIEFRNLCFMLTSHCNEKCKFCFRVDSKSDFDIEKLPKVISYLKSKNIKKITLTGGEPTLHRNLFLIANILKESGFTLSITTNATKFIPEILDIVDFISFSIETIDRKLIQKLGRTPCYIDNIEKYLSLADRKGKKVKINTLICSINAEEKIIRDIADYICSHSSVFRWKFFQFLELRLSSGKHYLHVSDSIFKKIVEFSKRYLRLKSCNLFVNISDRNDAYLILTPDGKLIESVKGTDTVIYKF